MNLIKDFSFTALIEPEINIWNLFLRLIISILLAAIIGSRQERKGRPAGLRTHIAISLGSACVMMLSIYVAQVHNVGDPGRIAAQVVSGIGFLGAGAIIKYGFNVIGMTTAASIWTTAAIGLVVGVGLYPLAIGGTLFLFITLSWIRRLEKKVFKRHKKQSKLIITAKGKNINTVFNEIKKILYSYDIKITQVSFSAVKKQHITIMRLNIRQPHDVKIFDVFTNMLANDIIIKIDVKNV